MKLIYLISGNRFSRFFFLLSLLLVTFIISAPMEGHCRFRQKQRVLVLHSYHKGLSWTEKLNNGIEGVFKNAQENGDTYVIDFEYMDTKRYSKDDYYKIIYEIFNYKYRLKKNSYDVIISCDDNAFQFLLLYRNKLFGRVPVIFCGLNFFEDSILKGKSLYSGVVETIDVGATLDLILDNHKDTKEFVIVGDQTTSSFQDRKAINEVAANYRKKGIKFRFLRSGNIDEYVDILNSLDAGQVVLAMHLNKDHKGNFYTFEESFDIYSKDVKVPIYSFWDFYLGRGIVGGNIVSGASQGRAAANKALQVLNGQKIRNIPIMYKSPNEFMFDYNYLQKFKIPMNSLPANSLVINTPLSIKKYFLTYWNYILMILALISFLVGIIIILSLNIRRRLVVEKNLLNTNITYNKFVPHKFLDNINKKNIEDVQLGDNSIKNMAVLFSSIHAYSGIVDKLSINDNLSFLNNYLHYMAPMVRKNRGFIDKYLGDIVMGVFPDSPADAVKAAVEMQRSLIQLNENLKEMKQEPISIGIGIHIGAVMIGTVGESQRMEGTVISDTVNLSSRLAGLTKLFGSEIIISGETFSHLRPEEFNYRYLGVVRVKGKSEPVKIYEINSDNLKKVDCDSFSQALQHYSEGEMKEAGAQFTEILKEFPGDRASKFYSEKTKFYLENQLPEEWDGVEDITTK